MCAARPIKVRIKDGTDGQTDGRQIVHQIRDGWGVAVFVPAH